MENWSKKNEIGQTLGLVEKRRCGLRLPSFLYVKNFIVDEKYYGIDENEDEKASKNKGSPRIGKMYTSRPIENDGS